MSAAKHTPGPWFFDKMERSVSRFEENGCVRICQIDDVSREDNANARLIAAAPELLAALEWIDHLVSRGEGCDGDDMDAISVKARAAIAKAKGE